jgi:hypothetical protein
MSKAPKIPRGGAGGPSELPVPDVASLPLETLSSYGKTAKLLGSKGVPPPKAAAASASASVAASAAAPSSRISNDPARSYSGIINTVACVAEDTREACIQKKLGGAGLTHLPIVGDGNCLFYSFERFFNIYNLPPQTLTHINIRRAATKYLLAHTEEFLESFEIPMEEQGTLDAILASVVPEANYLAGRLNVGFANPAYKSAKLKLFKAAIRANDIEGTFASGIGDLMPLCLARLYNIRVSVYDYSEADQQFRVVNIDPSEVTGRPNQGHIRLERVNANHFNVLIPTATVEAYPRVRALVDFYTTLYDVEVAKEELMGVKGMLRYAEAAEKPVAQGIVDAQRATLAGLSELLVMRLLAANEVIPRWKSFPRYSDLLNANESSNENTNSNESASPIAAIAAIAVPKPLVKKTATAPVSLKASGYKAIGSAPPAPAAPAVVAVAAPKPIKKMPLNVFASLNNLGVSNNNKNNNAGTRKNKNKKKVPVSASKPGRSSSKLKKPNKNEND